MKKLLLILILVFFCSFVSGAIQNYTVPSQIPLGKNLVISGQLDSNAEMFCSFFLYDANDSEFVYQLTDEKTTSNGFISSSYFVLPGYNRAGEQITYLNKTYTARTRCGSSQADANFSVVKSIPLTDKVGNIFTWLKDNFISSTIIGIGLVLFIAFSVWLFSNRRR